MIYMYIAIFSYMTINRFSSYSAGRLRTFQGESSFHETVFAFTVARVDLQFHTISLFPYLCFFQHYIKIPNVVFDVCNYS